MKVVKYFCNYFAANSDFRFSKWNKTLCHDTDIAGFKHWLLYDRWALSWQTTIMYSVQCLIEYCS